MTSDADRLAERLRREISQLRAQQRIPTQVRLDQRAWNQLRTHMTYGAFGPRQAVLFEGLPCVLSIDLPAPFRVRWVEPGGEGS
jgi:hypothetical protein